MQYEHCLLLILLLCDLGKHIITCTVDEYKIRFQIKGRKTYYYGIINKIVIIFTRKQNIEGSIIWQSQFNPIYITLDILSNQKSMTYPKTIQIRERITLQELLKRWTILHVNLFVSLNIVALPKLV